MMIQTKRLVLRPWTIQDLNDLLAIANNRNIAMNMRDRFPHPYTREAGEEFLKLFGGEKTPQEIMCVTLNEKPIGSCGVFQKDDVYHKNAEIGYYIGEPYWGNGYATEAAEAIITHGFNSLPIERVCASVFSGNDASKKVLEKLGFNYDGVFRNSVFKFGEFRDEYHYSVMREKWFAK